MSKSAKGSEFERTISKQLSLWWTNGERNDVFWRTAGSGAMAKTRSKSKQSAFGQYGDVQATDPIGQSLIDLFTIELKRGYSSFTFADMLDKSPKAADQTYEKFIDQVREDQKNAGTKYWMLITKRNRREALVCIPLKAYRKLKKSLSSCHWVKMKISRGFVFIIKLEDFLGCVAPDNIVKKLK